MYFSSEEEIFMVLAFNHSEYIQIHRCYSIVVHQIIIFSLNFYIFVFIYVLFHCAEIPSISLSLPDEPPSDVHRYLPGRSSNIQSISDGRPNRC